MTAKVSRFSTTIQAALTRTGYTLHQLHRDSDAWIVRIDGKPIAMLSLQVVGRLRKTSLTPYVGVPGNGFDFQMLRCQVDAAAFEASKCPND